MQCSRCNANMQDSEILCPYCGFVNDSRGQTLVLKTDPALYRIRRQLEATMPADALDGYLILRIRGVIERLPLERVNQIILGRADIDSGFNPDIDLNRYGAAERGVSRSHLMLHFHDKQLIAIDLSSVNGSLLNGTRMEPSIQYTVRDGSELMLGRLSISINILLAHEPTSEDQSDTLPQ